MPNPVLASDHDLANELLAALGANRLTLAEQPIRLADSGAHLLYRECLLRSVDPAANASLYPHIAASERLGYARKLDLHVAHLVLERLQRRSGARLGINISASSASLDAEWDAFFAKLDAMPGVAQRLVIEVTETARLASGYEAFFDCLRSRGIKIAMDDFGAGHSTRIRLMSLRPDIVKIDSRYTRLARTSERHAMALRKLAQYLRNASCIVVLEGVETDEDRLSAFSAGIAWLQGFGVGEPAPAH